MTRVQKFWIGFFILLGLILTLLYQMARLLWPFFSALLIAYMLAPLIGGLLKRGFRKGAAVWTVFLGFLLILITSAGLLVSVIRTEIPVVQEKIPQYLDFLQTAGIPRLEALFHFKFPKSAQDYMRGIIERLLNISPEMAASLSNFASEVFSRTLTVFLFLIDLLLIPVFLLYLLFDLERIGKFIPRIVPRNYQETLLFHLGEIDRILRRFVGGQVLISSLLALLYMIGLTWIGLDLSVILGLFSGLINVVPYVGVAAGGLISALFAAFKFHDPGHPFLVIGLFATGHLLDEYYLKPRVIGQRIGLHPVLVMLSLIVGGNLFGLPGLFLAMPVAAILNYLSGVGFGAYKRSRFYSGLS